MYSADFRAEDIQWLPRPGVDTRGVVAALVQAARGGASRVLAASLAGERVNYGYDATGQLIGADYAGGVDELYSYDANGNRTMAGYVVGAGNRLLSDGTYRYAYDAEGNRSARFIDVNADGLLNAGDTDVTQYGWDHHNRLASVTTYAAFGGPATQVVCYAYDVQNRWLGQSIDAGGDGTIDRQVRFAYDGHQIVLQFAGDCPDLAAQNGTVPFALDGDGNPRLTAANLAHRYLWGPAVDQLLADEQVEDVQSPGTVVWPLADNLGTVRDLAVHDAQTGVTRVANHRVYDSFGKLVSQTDAAVDCLFSFTGRAFDTKTGLQNNLNRWYDLRTEIWMNQDPKGFTAGDTNAGRYVGNRPTVATDSAGLDPWDATAPQLTFRPPLANHKASYLHAISEASDWYRTLTCYSSAGLARFLSDLRRVGEHYVKRVYVDKWMGSPGRYQDRTITFVAPIVHLPDTRKDFPPIIVLHETIHAWDDRENWYWSPYKAEALAYTAEYVLVWYHDYVGRFQGRLASALMAEDALTAWKDLWRADGPDKQVIGQQVEYYLLGYRYARVSEENVRDVAEKLKLSIDFRTMALAYRMSLEAKGVSWDQVMSVRSGVSTVFGGTARAS